MRNFILDKMGEIHTDFMIELYDKNYYCDLKDFRFDGINVPDYNNSLIQKYYLLRYMPAYLAEYFIIYDKMFNLSFLDNNYNIVSIGSGCGVDLWGAKFALDESYLGGKIKYTGFDTVDWEYKDDLGMKDVYFINKDITSLNNLDEDDYNVIIFPKSIGEFDEYGFWRLKDIMENTQFNNDKIVLLSSIRKTRLNLDIHRLAEIVNVFTDKHNYICLDSKNECWYIKPCSDENPRRLEEICPGFIYPEDLKTYLTNLNNNCSGFIENNRRPCEEECENMNKWPILTASQIRYQVLRLQR